MRRGPLATAISLLSFSLVLYELVLTRIFAIVLFAQFAHLAISLALLGIGVGATALHLFPRIVPEDRLAERLGILALGVAGATTLSVFLAVTFPFTSPRAPELGRRIVDFVSRRHDVRALVRPWYLAAIAPFIALPFACAGAGFAAAFRQTRERIGGIYAADLCGGAIGCLAFLPTLWVLRGPDAVTIAALAASIAGWVSFHAAGARKARIVAAVATGVALAGVLVGTRTALFRIRYSAGFDEAGVVEERWTPLARIGAYEAAGRTFIMLDNASRSEVVRTEGHAKQHARRPFGAVFKLHRPGRVMILAAGAGAEIVAARRAGHQDITAAEIAPQMFDIVRERYADAPMNPFRMPNVRTVGADARSAVLHDPRPFDVIEVYQANFYSYGGMLAEAWNGWLLFTREAFAGYLAHLRRGGMISISSGPAVVGWTRDAAAALRDRGVRDPARHIAYFRQKRGSLRALIVKREAFTVDEVERLREILRVDGNQLLLDPSRPSRGWRKSFAPGTAVMTDDHPFWDDAKTVKTAFRGLFGGRADTSPNVFLQRVLIVQLGLLLVAGMVFLGLPYVWRGRAQVGRSRGAGPVLAYFAAIGYGYLAVEMVLIHRLALFVGHPTYAVTLVLFVLLVSSGLGSFVAGTARDDRVGRRLVGILLVIVLVAAVHAFFVSPLLERRLLGLALRWRVLVAGASLFPVGFAMGMPLPLALRRMPPLGAAMVPWCWAINGWMSVFSAVATVVVARVWSYSSAFAVGLVAYSLALPLSLRLGKLRPQ